MNFVFKIRAIFFGELWMCCKTLKIYYSLALGFGRGKEGKTLWRGAAIALIWCV
jgi:hypothetical protein